MPRAVTEPHTLLASGQNPIVLRGMKGRRHVPRPVSWGMRQGSPQDDGQMPPWLLASLPGTCLLVQGGGFTQPCCISQQAVPHIPSLHFLGTVTGSPFPGSSAPAAALLRRLHHAAGGERFGGTVFHLFPSSDRGVTATP